MDSRVPAYAASADVGTFASLAVDSLDETGDDAVVGDLLRVPLNADHWDLTLQLEGLDHPVVREGHWHQPVADVLDRLVVVAASGRRTPDYGLKPGAGGHANRLAGELATGAVILVPTEIREVLLERATAPDIEHLRPSADGEYWQTEVLGGRERGQFGCITLRFRSFRSLVTLLSVKTRIDVRAPAQNESVEPVENGAVQP